MKTSAALILAIFLFVAPAFARKHDSCPLNGKAGKRSTVQRKRSMDHRRSLLSSAKSPRAIRKRNKKFETPRNTLSHSASSRNVKSHTKYSSGGFYSFRRHNYSAHIFHR
ncbi:MAG: hypothetical protein HY064_08240 [Bacteroidetes bacterium]|nr:hypothetical protein [Bacteroidota bacterium]